MIDVDEASFVKSGSSHNVNAVRLARYRFELVRLGVEVFAWAAAVVMDNAAWVGPKWPRRN